MIDSMKHNSDSRLETLDQAARDAGLTAVEADLVKRVSRRFAESIDDRPLKRLLKKVNGSSSRSLQTARLTYVAALPADLTADQEAHAAWALDMWDQPTLIAAASLLVAVGR